FYYPFIIISLTYFFEHWDVKNAFVNAPLKEEIFVKQVPGFEKKGQENKILKLKKALYGTKQAAHAWQAFLKENFLSLGGRKNLKDKCVWIFKEEDAFS